MDDTLTPLAHAAVQRLAYTVDEAAEASTLGKSTIKTLIANGQLHSTLVRGRRLIPVDALAELVRGGAA